MQTNILTNQCPIQRSVCKIHAAANFHKLNHSFSVGGRRSRGDLNTKTILSEHRRRYQSEWQIQSADARARGGCRSRRRGALATRWSAGACCLAADMCLASPHHQSRIGEPSLMLKSHHLGPISRPCPVNLPIGGAVECLLRLEPTLCRSSGRRSKGPRES